MIKKVSVLGAGTMGRGIAWIFAQKGFETTLYDPDENALKAAYEILRSNAKVADEAINYIKCTTNLHDSIYEADFVIESIPEDIQIKRQLYDKIAPYLKEEAVIASNTSSFSLALLSHKQPFSERFIIAHFFNPAHIIPLVEIVQSDHTKPGLVKYIASFLTDCGKVPVILKKDINGFIANRLQAAVLREACYLLENGIAEASDIDTVMMESIGVRWALNGPFEIADYGGLDIWENVLKNLLPVLDNTTLVPEVISEKIRQHNFGLKSGKGFYNYEIRNAGSILENQKKKLNQILEVKKL